jgi:hypothetical protein
LSLEDEMLSMARQRESASEANVANMWLEHPSRLRIQLRSDLARQSDLRRLKRSDDRVVNLNPPANSLQQLVCPGVEFLSDSRLNFKIEMEELQQGWILKRFQFHLHLLGRSIRMVRIHLNQQAGYDPLMIPRCHLHIGDSKAHIPFPIMSPRLMVHLICEHIEPDLGL